MLNKKFFNNIFYAFGAQLISLVLSMILSLVVPKMIGVEAFGYWQLFIFYSSYISFFHFGINDGIYLINGGKKKSSLDSSEIKSIFVFSIIMEIIISIGIFFVANSINISENRLFVIEQTLVNFILFCAANYLGYVFQAVNETKTFSFSVIINKVTFIIFLVLMLITRANNYEIFIYGYNVTQLISLIYCIYKGKDFLSARLNKFSVTLKDVIRTINIGSKLMIANIASMLILGIARFLVDSSWGIEVFSKFSFALTLVNFFLLFINQFSMVMFPALRQVDSNKQRSYYILFNDLMDIVLPACLIFYFPIRVILAAWLPEYNESIYYFGFLLPLCCSNGKMQMVNTTYLKVMREEKQLLLVNIFSVLLSLILTATAIYLVKSFVFLLISLVFTMWVRNLISERFLCRKFKLKSNNFVTDFLLILGYLIFITYFKFRLSCILYTILYAIFLWIKRKKIIYIISSFKTKEF